MRIASILGIVILGTISITVKAQTVTHSLPRLIQNLSDEDYAIWAQWQNRQAIRRAEENAERTNWTKYDYANRIVSNSFSRGSATTQKSGTSNSSGRSGSRSTTRNGHAYTNTSRFGGTTITSYQVRYRNPNYVGPGITITYNPWVRHEDELSTPDWAYLFVPCKEDTITMQEVLDRLVGPQNPEKVFEIMMEGYFGD